MSNSSNLHRARANKNDEFYTQLSDIENEMKHYKKHFKNKIIFCNCDDPKESNFFQYFMLNFTKLGIKKLITTHYRDDEPSYKLELNGDINIDGKINFDDIIKTPLKQNGDFRSPECIEILEESDIVITNPPFSLFGEYIAQLIEYNKKFLFIGPMANTGNKNIFPLVRDNKLWWGISKINTFLTPDGSFKKFGNILWYTNLGHQKQNEELILYKEYNELDYPKYDNFNVINIDKVKDIPIDYKEAMGVPISFIGKYNPNQFEILNCNNFTSNDKAPFKPNGLLANGSASLNGKAKFTRIVIKKK